MGRVADDDTTFLEKPGSGFTAHKRPTLDLGCFAEVLVEQVS